ncbi:acetyl-CoA carboxylase, biotin carboxyl carrier protein [Deferribacter desulfuricans SSM1]|uniref:Biotin carboxyl carrier protein of acetyl-CoA carboxylase n=1 Tax=Deferribacter desulfuricans (strain DSM 14783 / JCM 11476 / NBRC 101012 / SSM1) TaxID=639282 RepID=D3PBH7_DEFDS|nr:acetyl-CoA carboxylase biotin carboxyl carrier protein [Deferribacter desulfuricans]BAI79950.1 acetyl-CoA carboxylase, biotin carboxyl carrier protein [Deferribacter desulfuricans SSM1]
MDLKVIKELVKLIDKSNITEFEYESDTERIYLSKNVEVNVVPNQSASQPVVMQPSEINTKQESDSGEQISSDNAESTKDSNYVEIKSPIVGTFYEAPAPGAEPFVKEGDTVKKGQTLCIIEAMKIMNEIEAEFDCKIIKKVGQNAKPVEYGETIFIVEPL